MYNPKSLNGSNGCITLIFILLKSKRSHYIYLNANKTESMCFKREEAISTLSDRFLKLKDKFRYLSSHTSSTESDVNIRLAKTLSCFLQLIDPITAYRSDLFVKIKWDFSELCLCSYSCMRKSHDWRLCARHETLSNVLNENIIFIFSF